MIADVESFVRYFEGIHRRTARDVADLPSEAETWTPPEREEEEASWGVPQLVRHVAEARGFFVSAYLGRGWVWDPWPEPMETRDRWVPGLQASFDRAASALREGPDRLRERVDPIGGEGPKLSGWRVLMMMAEHEVHHRAQISAYAGLNGWPVHQTFGLTNEFVVAQLEDEVRRSRG